MLKLIKQKIELRKKRKRVELTFVHDCDIILSRLECKVYCIMCYIYGFGKYGSYLEFRYTKPYYYINRGKVCIHEGRFRHPYFISYLYLRYFKVKKVINNDIKKLKEQ